MKGIIGLLLIVALIVGEVMCVVKFINSDFKPSYKREIVYGLSFITGIGGIVGWMNIPDSSNCCGR